MVLEAGNWKLADGTIVKVGTIDTNANVASTWETVDLQDTFTEKPVVFSQVQTTNNSQFIRTRQQNGTATGFSVALEKEEKLKYSQYQEDTIGWLAISSGEGSWDNNYYQAGNTGDNVTDTWYGLNLSDNFTETPQLLASIGTYDGGDPAGLRSREITGATGSTIEIQIEEDKSLDEEIRHTTEDVNFFAIEGTGLLTAQVYDTAANSFAIDGNVGLTSEEDIFAMNAAVDI